MSMTKKQLKELRQKDVKVLSQAVENAEAMLIEGGSIRVGFSNEERKVMAEVIYDDLQEAGLLRIPEQIRELVR